MTESRPASVSRWLGQWRPAWPLLLLALLAVLIGAISEPASSALRYERQPILDGQVWRLLTGHLVHLSASHLWLNIAGLGLVIGLFGRGVAARYWWFLMGCSMLAMASGFLIFEPRLSWYVGLSGLLHGLILGGAFFDLTFPCRERNVLVIVVVIKLCWEQLYGPLPMTADAAGGPVVVDAHLYGAIGGILAVVMFWVREKHRTRV